MHVITQMHSYNYIVCDSRAASIHSEDIGTTQSLDLLRVLLVPSWK